MLAASLTSPMQSCKWPCGWSSPQREAANRQSRNWHSRVPEQLHHCLSARCHDPLEVKGTQRNQEFTIAKGTKHLSTLSLRRCKGKNGGALACGLLEWEKKSCQSRGFLWLSASFVPNLHMIKAHRNVSEPLAHQEQSDTINRSMLGLQRLFSSGKRPLASTGIFAGQDH